jgi:hypothetical protein
VLLSFLDGIEVEGCIVTGRSLARHIEETYDVAPVIRPGKLDDVCPRGEVDPGDLLLLDFSVTKFDIYLFDFEVGARIELMVRAAGRQGRRTGDEACSLRVYDRPPDTLFSLF